MRRALRPARNICIPALALNFSQVHKIVSFLAESQFPPTQSGDNNSYPSGLSHEWQVVSAKFLIHNKQCSNSNFCLDPLI